VEESHKLMNKGKKGFLQTHYGGGKRNRGEGGVFHRRGGPFWGGGEEGGGLEGGNFPSKKGEKRGGLSQLHRRGKDTGSPQVI